MGLFDIFKKQKQSQPIENKTPPVIAEQGKEDSDSRVYELAYALTKYKEFKMDYNSYKKELQSFGFDDSKIVHNSIGIALQYYYANEKNNALKLYEDLNNDYPENEDIIWLFIEVINTINIENDQEFVKKYLDHKKLKNDFNHHYQTEYQRGLELKSKNYFTEAVKHWTSLNKIQEFSWNYYQIGILQNVMGNENCLINLRKGIEMENEIKEDAKSYHELDNLRENPDFLKLIE